MVSAVSGAVGRAAEAVKSLGGSIGRPLNIIEGFAANVPPSALEAIRSEPSVRFIELDARLAPMGSTSDGPVVSGAISTVTSIVGAPAFWKMGITGKGVDVALIDTGVAPVPGIQTGKLINGPDLSFDYQVGFAASIDAYGHGTHMAGIIAGRDEGAALSEYTDPSKFIGVAPGARIVNVKVGAFDGGADVSQVIAAIDWVVQHRRDNGLNIRVLNLSFGTNSSQDFRIDPLSFAAEVAWRRGIVVVAAGGNDGTNAATLADPALNPMLLAVGAEDPLGTLGRDDDVIPDWSSRGNAKRGVDVVAPGVSVQSLMVPGSYVATQHPGSIVNDRFIKGSGTSQATAAVSGLVALLLQQFPDATPNQIKLLLSRTAYPIAGSTQHKGFGIVDGAKIAKHVDDVQLDDGNANDRGLSKGTGTLEGARGGVHVVYGADVLTGEKDIFGTPWNGQSWSGQSWSGSSWSGGQWNGQSWSGSSWAGSSWANVTWSASAWNGQSWSGTSWSGQSWGGQSWNGSSWSGSSWSGSSWSGSSWSGSSWSGSSWSGSSWSSVDW